MDEDQILGTKGAQMVETLSLPVLSRWYALLMAIDSIDDFCVEHNCKCTDEILRPIPIKHYIDSKHLKILNDLEIETAKSESNKQLVLQHTMQKIIERTHIGQLA